MIARWTEFNGGPRKPSRERLHVTLNEKGVLLLNRRAWETLGEPAAVTLLFDQTNDMIGIKPSEIDRPNAFPVKGQHYSRIIYASTFCIHFGFDIERTMVFNEVELDEHGIMRLRLRTATAISHKRKKRGH